jgi:hypothetical protein
MKWRVIRLLPLVVAAAGLLTPLVASGGSVWPATLVWATIVAAAAIWEFRFQSTRRTRIIAVSAALPILFLAGWEGGWWLIPAALVQLAVEIPRETSRGLPGPRGVGAGL